MAATLVGGNTSVTNGWLEMYIYKMHGEGALPTSTIYGVGARAINGSMIHRFLLLDTHMGI